MGIRQRQRQEDFPKDLWLFLVVQKRDRSTSGFTLLELVVISVMVGILAVIAAPSFFGYLNRQQLNVAQDRILQTLRQAQGEARRRQEPYQFSLTTLTEGGEEFLAVAVHPTDILDTNGDGIEDLCIPDPDNFSYERLIDTDAAQLGNATFPNLPGTCGAQDTRTRFNSRGESQGLGQVTLQLAGTPEVRRCVFVSTILGALRTDQDADCPVPAS